MSDNHSNGAAKSEIEGRPAITIYETSAGVVFYITPISLPTLRAIQLKAEDLFPYPPEKDYEIPDPVEVAFTPGQVSPASDNPEYVARCKEIDAERKTWTERAIFNYCVRCPKYPTEEAMIAAFKPQLDALRQIAVIDLNDFDTVLFHIVLTWNQTTRNASGKLDFTANEYGRIIELCVQTVALTASEVAAGVRFFRPKVQ